MLKSMLKKVILYAGPLYLIRKMTTLKNGPGITIFYGHRVLPDSVMTQKEQHRILLDQTSESDVRLAIKFLSARYQIISMDEAVEQIKTNKILDHSVVLTFDDGFQDNFTTLLPILKEMNVPATLYVNASVIGTKNNLWFQSVINYFFLTKASNIYSELSQQEYDLSSANSRYQAAFHFMKYLQANHKPEEFESIIQSLTGATTQLLGVDRHLTWQQLKALSREKLITIGAHTVHHYPLTLCIQSLANKEIADSKNILETRLGIPVEHFSYPRGHEEDFNDEHVAQLKQLGMKSAVTTIRGLNYGNNDTWRLKRVGFPQQVIDRTDELLWYTAGVPQMVAAIKQRKKSLVSDNNKA